MLYREIIVVCSQIHTKHTDTLCGQNGEFRARSQNWEKLRHVCPSVRM